MLLACKIQNFWRNVTDVLFEGATSNSISPIGLDMDPSASWNCGAPLGFFKRLLYSAVPNRARAILSLRRQHELPLSHKAGVSLPFILTLVIGTLCVRG